MEKARKGFETGRVCNHVTDWEEDLFYYADKTPEERLEGLTALVNQYIYMFDLPVTLDKTFVQTLVPFHVEVK